MIVYLCTNVDHAELLEVRRQAPAPVDTCSTAHCEQLPDALRHAIQCRRLDAISNEDSAIDDRVEILDHQPSAWLESRLQFGKQARRMRNMHEDMPGMDQLEGTFRQLIHDDVMATDHYVALCIGEAFDEAGLNVRDD